LKKAHQIEYPKNMINEETPFIGRKKELEDLAGLLQLKVELVGWEEAIPLFLGS
jgi:hypothetical protein